MKVLFDVTPKLINEFIIICICDFFFVILRANKKVCKMKNIAFIINPISGTQNKKKLPKLIDKCLDKSQWLENIVFTEYSGHATELARQFAQMGFDAVVAVGGDGTLHEVACGLVNSSTALGIIPIGSGNGFARHVGISTRINRAIETLNHSEVIKVDYGMVNDYYFFSTCGIGFDALVADKFATDGLRGFKGYAINSLKEWLTYKPETYHIYGDGIDMETTAFLITFANANQWGYEAHIAPKASIQDGKMDIAIMSQFPIIQAPSLALRLFTNSIDKDLHMNLLSAKEVHVIRSQEGPMHIDGDPIHMPQELHLRIVEDGLNLLVEKRF